MPHERGLKPVPPSQFFLNPRADPKTRFCRPLVNRQLQPTPIKGLRQLVDTKALNYRTQRQPDCLAQPQVANISVPPH